MGNVNNARIEECYRHFKEYISYYEQGYYPHDNGRFLNAFKNLNNVERRKMYDNLLKEFNEEYIRGKYTILGVYDL
jgi:hypothetical protein